jgi:hypothetical protein
MVGEAMKTELTPADKHKVWRATEPDWLHYYWDRGFWFAAPCDPRANPLLTNTVLASGQHDGVLTRPSGFEEARL